MPTAAAQSGSGPGPLRIQLLGGFRVSRADGAPVGCHWRRSTGRTLVKLLAVAPDRTRHREEVMDVMWPEADTSTGLRNLRVALHAARHALEPELAPRAGSAYILAEGELLRLAPGMVLVDAEEREAAALEALGTGDLMAMESALAALGPELLPEDRYEDWAEPSRAALGRLRDRLISGLAEGLLAAARPEAALQVLRTAVEDVPTDEARHLLLARTYLDTEQPRLAVQQYHACREALAEELGVRPSHAFEELHRRALSAIAPRRPPQAEAQPQLLPAAIGLPPPLPLIGRQRPFTLLTEHTVSTTGNPLVLVRGEAGIGKTRLVAETARHAARNGVTVLWGAVHEAEGHTPYGVFAEALDSYLAACPLAERAAIGAEHPGLTSLLPSLGSPPPAVGSPEEERARLFRAISGMLTDLAAVRPLLIVLDDLHNADPGSLSLLHYLVRTAHPRRWRFIGTRRGEPATPGGGEAYALDAFISRRMAVEIDLLRLSRAHCDELTAFATGTRSPAVPPDGNSRIFELSLGNPLFALELAAGQPAEHRAHGLPPEAAGDDIEIPDRIRGLVALRLARLPPDARRALSTLAVAGRGTVALAELEPVTARGQHPPLTGPAVVAALDAAVEAGIVDERDSVLGGRPSPGYAFRHPLVRLACADQLSRGARRLLHAAYADAVLDVRPGAVDAVAYHLSRADDARAPEFLRRAAQRAAALYANDTACGYYEELVNRLDTAADPDAALIRLDWADVLRRAARYGEAEDVLRRARRDLGDAGDRTGARRAAVALAEVLSRAGRAGEGLVVLGELAADMDTANAEERATLHVSTAALSFHAGLTADAARAADRAEDAVARLPEDVRLPLQARLFTVRAASCLLADRTREGRLAADRAMEAAVRTGDAALQSSALSVVGELARKEGRLEAGRDHARQAVAITRRIGDPAVLAFDQSNLAGAELLVGASQRADALAETAVKLARTLGATWCLPYTLVTLAEVRLRTGRLDEAETALTECAQALGDSADPQISKGMRRLAGELAELRGGGVPVR
ncbi:ATP-binding protein [Streptomyces sp. NPDC058409]|uniref:ATP-binding protein n=1 Tax=Streptomyces sp. NPDC058409 TaxID=3346484 RepID=UPI003657737C